MDGFTAGCVSGFSQIILGHPLDTYKTWLQNGTPNRTINLGKLYRGIKYPMVSNCVVNGVLFGTNHTVSQFQSNQWITGAITGIAMSVVCTPVELYKIRAQCGVTTKAPLYCGFLPTFCRETLACSVYFGTYHCLYETYDIPCFWSGGLAGVASWAIAHPIDTVKTKIQSGRCSTMVSAIKSGKLLQGLGFSCTRAFLVNAVGYWVYQSSLDWLQANRS